MCLGVYILNYPCVCMYVCVRVIYKICDCNQKKTKVPKALYFVTHGPS